MKNKQFNIYYLFSCMGVLLASYYPLSMGVRVISDMIAIGTVAKENYPKYIIPYTPISIAIIVGILLLPLCIKLFRRFAFVGGASVSIGVFFATELLFEQKVVVSTAETVTTLENWQMSMCYTPSPQEWNDIVMTFKPKTAVEILMGEYNPAFKLHFYVISVVLIVTILNSLYGFGQMVKTGETKRLKALVLQSVCSLVFLGLCILACFTAFWRDGSIQVSALSATLMAVFFVLLGVTTGVFVGSFLLGKRRFLSVWIPAIVASAMTALMYIGEMILLSGHLYRFGNGFFFESIPGIVLAPVDLLIIVAAGCFTALIFTWLHNRSGEPKRILILFGAICFVITLVIVLALWIGRVEDTASVWDFGGVDFHQRSFATVQLLEKEENDEESGYRVGAYLNGTNFTVAGQTLTREVAREWQIYDGLTDIQRLTSSKLWGCVSLETDTWKECEQAIGFAVNNPLESLDWLHKTGYFGMESADPNTPVKHIQINADATEATGRKLSEINVTAGYCLENIRITLDATLVAEGQFHTADSRCNGYATYEENPAMTATGIPVQTVSTDAANNNGYYHGDYFDLTTYWVDENVFYTLRVFGDEADRAEIQVTLDRILQGI